MANQLTRIPKFRRCVLQNFPFIEQDFDALTDYQLLCKVVEYLNKVITSQNEVIEIAESLTAAFNELQSFVENYFDNLDVQDEINNKLDQMAEDGTLQEIMGQYLQTTAIWGFDTVADMKASTNLIDGSFAKTIGFHSLNDGGGATYRIREVTNEDTVNELDLIAITYDNQLVAELIKEYPLNAKQYGAYGDNTHDDTTAIQNLLNVSATDGGDVFFPAGKYKVTSPITINWGQNLTNPRPKLQVIYGSGSQSFESTYDGTAIIGYNIPQYRGIIELLGSGNTWSTHVKLSDISLIQDEASCNQNSFCLFYGDANQFELNKVKMLGFNDVYVRCGTNHDNGGSGYAGINTRFINSVFNIFEDYSKGFAILPERIVTGSGDIMDNILIESCMFGGVALLEAVMVKINSSHIALRMAVKDKTTTNIGILNGMEIDYSTGILLSSFYTAKISELYCEDYRRGVDILPLRAINGTVTFENCYFNARSNQTSGGVTLIADYGIIARANPSHATWVVKNLIVKDCMFRQSSGGSNYNFNQVPIYNAIADEVECDNNINFDSFTEVSVTNTLKNGFHYKPVGYKRSEDVYDIHIDSLASNGILFKFENEVDNILLPAKAYPTGIQLYFDTAVGDAEDFVITVRKGSDTLYSFPKNQFTASSDKKYFYVERLSAGTGTFDKNDIMAVRLYSTSLTGLVGKSVKGKIIFNR